MTTFRYHIFTVYHLYYLYHQAIWYKISALKYQTEYTLHYV
jgi:hypothetical protein